MPSVQALRTLGKFHKAKIESMILRKLEYHQHQELHLHSSPRLISKKTGCYKPCSYRKYSLIGDPQEPPTSKSFTDGFMLCSFSNDQMVGKTKGLNVYWLNLFSKVETEQLIYPWQSLVAEFGGSLGLFLGFSLMTIWDVVGALKNLKLSKILLL